MNSTPQIFKDRLIQKRLARFTRDNIPDFDTKFKEIGLWCNATAEQHLDRTKETAVQGAFMTRLFNQVFGYLEIIDAASCYNQEREFKTVLDTTEADGALGFFYKDSGKKDVRVVIELKDARTPLDKKQNRSNHLTPVEQAFSYRHILNLLSCPDVTIQRTDWAMRTSPGIGRQYVWIAGNVAGGVFEDQLGGESFRSSIAVMTSSCITTMRSDMPMTTKKSLDEHRPVALGESL